jgi:hypothetical protein
MPYTVNTTTEARAVNAAMALAFFPRAKNLLIPRFSAQAVSTSEVEPWAMNGAVPPLSQFRGSHKVAGIPSYNLSVPNTLHKNLVQVKQSSVEFDQTQTTIRLAEQTGLRLAEYVDLLGFKRILSGSTVGDAAKATTATSGVYAPAGSVTCKDDEGTAHTLTIDSLPFFSASHTFDGGVTTQSNNIQMGSGMPATKAGVLAQAIDVTANQMASDLQAIIDKIRTVYDNTGTPFFPSLDQSTQITVMVPPFLLMAAHLAFAQLTPQPGDGVINQSTRVAQMFVKEIVSHGYLSRMPDPERELIPIAPLNETDWYVLVTDDYVRPMYIQTFRAKTGTELAPPGYSPDAEIDRIMALDSSIDVPTATLWASTRVDSTFDRVGQNSDPWTMINEAFMASARYRGNIAYGFWPTFYRLYPANGNG